MSTTFNAVFLFLGWTLWLLALALIILGIGQFLNTFIQLLVKTPLLKRIDGLAGICAITILLLMVTLIFTQITFSNGEYQRLESYNLPFGTEEEKLANVIQLQAAEGKRSDSFTNGMLIGAAFPFTNFRFHNAAIIYQSSNRSSGMSGDQSYAKIKVLPSVLELE